MHQGESKSEKLESFCVKVYEGKELPTNFLALRRRIYIEEMGYLSENTLTNSWDGLGVHIAIEHRETGEVIASGHVYLAEEGEWAEHSGADPATLTHGIFCTRFMVAPEFRSQKISRLLHYLTAQQGRIWGRSRAFCYIVDGEKPTRQVWNYELLENMNCRHVTDGKNGQTSTFVPATQDIENILCRAFDQMTPDQQAFCREQMVSEIVGTTTRRIKDFFTGPFFSTVASRQLTRHQYIRMLSCLHQFVRFTTRILGRAISLSESSSLRRHFIEHLSGEVDHEVQLENDLRILGADVEFVKTGMIPSRATQRFMTIQESALAFHQDPLAFIGVPYSIEGFTAHLDTAFMENLEACIASWGVKNPKKASTFLRLHIDSDGGDDGHWENNRKVLAEHVRSERQLKRVLNVIHLTFDSMEELYTSFVDEPALQNIRPESEGRKAKKAS